MGLALTLAEKLLFLLVKFCVCENASFVQIIELYQLCVNVRFGLLLAIVIVHVNLSANLWRWH